MFKTKYARAFVILAIIAILILFLLNLPKMGKSVEEAPNFSFVDIEGDKYNLSDFSGNVIILDFMATWCNPCADMMENLVEIKNKYPDLVIISIDVDPTESIEKLMEFREKFRAEWIFTIDDGEISKKYGVVGIPKTIVIDASGRMVFSHIGVVSVSKLSSEIEKAYAGEAGGIRILNFGLPLIAFISGILSFFSPCSFPLLPAYIGYYVGRREGKEEERRQLLKEGVVKGLQPAFGIALFYGLIGLSIVLLGDSIKYFIPYFEPIIAILIIILGVVMLTKIATFSKLTDSIVARLSKITGGKRYDLFLYGVIYGAASAGCTMPIFISVVFLAISFGSILFGVAIFFIYVSGMMIFMVIATIIIAFSADMLAKFRIFSKYVEETGGLLLIAAGLLLLYYAFW